MASGREKEVALYAGGWEIVAPDGEAFREWGFYPLDFAPNSGFLGSKPDVYLLDRDERGRKELGVPGIARVISLLDRQIPRIAWTAAEPVLKKRGREIGAFYSSGAYKDLDLCLAFEKDVAQDMLSFLPVQQLKRLAEEICRYLKTLKIPPRPALSYLHR